MEQLRRPAFRGAAGGGASSAYADVFGGPPRHSRTFAARLGDYDDVFGGLASSCSIPVLDLPPAMEAHDPPRSSGLDYFEIFGGFERGGVPTYEELVAEEEMAAAEIQFSNGRSPNETELGQQRIEIPEFRPDHTNRNDVACLEKDQITSIANHLNDSSKQLNMPYHKTSQANIEDGMNETPNTTQPRVISGFSAYMNVSQPSPSVRNDVPSNMVNGDFSLNTSLNDRIGDQKHRRSFSSSSSAASSKCSGNDLRINEKQLAPKDAPANTKLHSCSSSNHSTSSGDVCFSDFPYVSVSDIGLSTQPVQVPPPSRPPLKLADDQEIAKMKLPANSKTELDKTNFSKPIPSQKKYSVGNAPKRRAPQVPIRDRSFFFDVEVDASSAAAASAAAMKEAMEQAQARLKSAKESMERKRDNIPSRKKLGSNEGSKFEDGKKARSAQEIKMFNEEVDQKTFLKEKKKNEFTIEERYKARGAAKVAPDHEEKERLVVSYEQDQHMVQPNKFTSSQASSKLSDTTVEWKTDNQFYELVSNEKKFRVTTELSDKRSTDKVLKGAINVDEERENESRVSDLSCQLEKKGISLKVHETRNREGKDKKSNICDREFVEVKKELPNKIPNNFGREEKGNKLEEVSCFPQLVEDDTELCEVQEAHAKKEEVKKPNIGERVPARAETEMEMKRCIDAPNFEADCANTEKESKLEAAKEVCGNDGVELSKDSVTCQPCETGKKPEIAIKIDTQVEEDEIKTPYASCTWDARVKVEPTPEMNQHDNYTKAREITAPECYQESGNLPKDTSLASEQHESRNESRTEDASIFVKNDLKVKATEEAKETKTNLEELQSAESGIGRSEIEPIESVEWEYYEENKTDAQIELQQNAKVQTPTQASCELENSEVLTVAVRVHEKEENENTGEVHVHMNMKEKYNIFNVAQEVFRRVVNKDVEDIQVANFLGKNGKMSSRNTTDICPVITEQTVPDMRMVEEKDKERRIQKELEKERRLEEEREREREREKDRIAVEIATREARERSLSESRERAERIAVERVTAEARQRALAEAREKAEKASAEALEKSFAEKAAREARLRTERAAVERATAEARERAVERALAEKAAADARERAEKLNAASSRDKTRKDNETEEHSRLRSKGDVGTREKQDLPHDAQLTNQRRMDSYNHVGEGESALRCKARLERHQRMVERAAKALAEKNMRDVLAQREQAERNRLAEMVDAEVRRWSAGKEGNLRALLSTLQYILGPESGWHPIPLTELITAAAVKKGYRKATLCVHPDKLQQRGANIHQKYICEKVFDLLKDAWNKFNSEER